MFDTFRLDTPLNNGLYEENYNDGTIEHDSEPSTNLSELLEGMDNG